MRRSKKKYYRSANGFSAGFNRDVGSFLYRIVFLGILVVGLKIWGIGVIDDVWIFVITIIAYKLVGFFLHKIGFWPKWNWF